MNRKIIVSPPFEYIIFGVTGDLATKKLLPALFHRYVDGQVSEDSKIIGCARQSKSNDVFKQEVRQLLEEQHQRQAGYVEKIALFLELLSYIQLDVNKDRDWASLATNIAGKENGLVRVFYLSVGPSLFEPTLSGLKTHKLNRNARMVVEKPLGFDLGSAKKLNRLLTQVFSESCIYRIDHYLGKETVQNLMALRFANSMFEPLWNYQYIDHVQITVAETVGVQGRGGYYDKSGAMRDMVQNHLIQLLCLCAMEAPRTYEADSVRDEKLKVLHSLKPITGEAVRENTVRGQYVESDGQSSYKKDVGNLNSSTESYVALRVEIENWRWSGVPFYLRTGKKLKANQAEIKIVLKSAPHLIFGDNSHGISQNALIIRLQPNEGVDLQIVSKEPGLGGMRFRQTILDTTIAEQNDKSPRMNAYERLMLDVVRGDQTLFMRGDEVEASWCWIDPIIEAWEEAGEPPEEYPANSSGPFEADFLLRRNNRSWSKLV